MQIMQFKITVRAKKITSWLTGDYQNDHKADSMPRADLGFSLLEERMGGMLVGGFSK